MNRVGRAAMLLAIGLVVGGCHRPEQGTGAGEPSRGAPAGAVTLTVWDWYMSDPSRGIGLWLAQVDRKFEQIHPNIKIHHVGLSRADYYARLQASNLTGAAPDIVMLEEGSRVLEHRDRLRPLAQYVTPDLKRNIVGWELTSNSYDPNDAPWAVPITVQGLVWYVNKAVLKEAGFRSNTPPSTWTQFVAACAAVQAKGKMGIAAGDREGEWSVRFINSAAFQTLAPGDGERLSNGDLKWTAPSLQAVLIRLKELYDRGCFPQGVVQVSGESDAESLFKRGGAAFFLGQISDLAQWKEFGVALGPNNLSVMPCPVFQPGPDANKFPVGDGDAYAITRSCPHPTEAFQYIAFVAGNANAPLLLTQAGSFPANQSYDHSLIEDPTARTLEGWMAQGRTGPLLTGETPTAVTVTLRRECVRYLNGQTNVENALGAVEDVATAERTRSQRRP